MIFMAGGNAYSLVHEHKTGWNPEAFRERYSEVLERFDYIVGDWGYNQLRLRGFYRDGHPRATKESTISSFVDYINEYCNFGCAHFVLTKLDSNALPPEAEISKEETPEAIIALSETGEQAAETAAAAAATHNGPLMRWPLKERAGGPVRVPNITVSAVARAAADAERRHASANAGKDGGHSGGASSSQSRGHSYKGQDGGNNGRQGRSYTNNSTGGERRSQPSGQSNGGQASMRQQNPRAPRQQNGEQQVNRPALESRPSESRPSDPGGQELSQSNLARQEGGASRGDNRWHGKNRRRKTFGGKPNHRPDGASRPDSGAPRSIE